MEKLVTTQRVNKSAGIIFVLFNFFVYSNIYCQNYLWANGFGTTITATSLSEDVAVDANGNSYITGYFRGTVDFDPGSAVANLTASSTSGPNPYDIFIAKYNSAGNLMWAKGIGSTGDDEGTGIAIDGLGNVYISGVFEGTVDFDPSSATATLSSMGTSDVFFAKYDSNGNYIFAKSIGNTGLDYVNDIKVDAVSNIYITGYFYNTVDFDPSSSSIATLSSNGGADIFIAKYGASGNYNWAHSLGNNSSTLGDSGNGIVVDGNGNVYLTGYFSGTVDFNPQSGTANCISNGSSDIFFAKFSSSGIYGWVRAIGSFTNDSGIRVELDGAANIYLTGTFGSTMDFDAGVGTSTLGSAGGLDIFLLKYDSSGTYNWAKAMGSSGVDRVYGLNVNANSTPFIIGQFSGTVDFDPGPATKNLISAGSLDVFFARYDLNGNYLWAHSFGSAAAAEHGRGIAVDATGSTYITGTFFNTVDFDPGSGTANLNATGGHIFLAKYSPACYIVVHSPTNSVCIGSSVTLSTTATSSISWSTGASSPSIVVTPSVSTTYTMSGSAATGTTTCSSTAAITVSVSTLPTVSLFASNITACVGEQVVFSASGANSYSWSTGGTGASTMMTMNSPGTHTFVVIGTEVNGCSKSTSLTITVSNCVDLKPFIAPNEIIKIFPNPTKGKFYVSTQTPANGELKISDVSGRILSEQKIIAQEQIINILESPGVYFVEVFIDGTRKIFRLIVE